MTPHASALSQPVTHLSRFTGRPVATGPDGKPLWTRKHKETTR